ncbi:MAG: LysM peptidoglycan-binding domain-containing protein [Verrucomicrobiales bacterium]|nr:LysM peptidoglycan-binding domain-containing protein [Verrucomicrobiales bacterium]
MNTFSKTVATSLALFAISSSAFAQEKVIKPIASPPIPTTTQSQVPTIPKVKKEETKKDETEKEAPVKQAAPEGPKEYVIQSGDNPWLIAKNHGISLEALMAANKIKDAKNLKIGDVLILPEGTESKNAPAPEKPEAAPAKTAAAPEEGDNWVLYTIKKGDNPWNISKALKVDHQKIISLNKGTDFTKLDIGQQIKVPKSAE